VIHAVTRVGQRLRFGGRDLSATTWLEVELPDHRRVPLFPAWVPDPAPDPVPDGAPARVVGGGDPGAAPPSGALEVDLDGLVVPDVRVPLVAVNPPPGGGPGPVFLLREHLPPS
jgi:hypothetical protein